MTLTTVVREQQGTADLPDLGGAHDDPRRFRLDLKQLLDGGEHADEVREEHALEHARQAEHGEEHLLGGERLEPRGREAAAEAAAQLLVVVILVVVGVPVERLRLFDGQLVRFALLDEDPVRVAAVRVTGAALGGGEGAVAQQGRVGVVGGGERIEAALHHGGW